MPTGRSSPCRRLRRQRLRPTGRYCRLRRLRAPLNDIELEPLRQACDVGDYGTYIASAERTQL